MNNKNLRRLSILVTSQTAYNLEKLARMENTSLGRREPMKEHESILVFSRGKWTYNKQMQERTRGGNERVKYNVKFETTSKNYNKIGVKDKNMLGKLRVPSSWQKFNCEVGLHPTQKPVSLCEYLIKTYTNKGDTVLDNCMGSGTTGVACINTERNFVGIELNTEYFEIAKRRIENRENEKTDEAVQMVMERLEALYE